MRPRIARDGATALRSGAAGFTEQQLEYESYGERTGRGKKVGHATLMNPPDRNQNFDWSGRTSPRRREFPQRLGVLASRPRRGLALSLQEAPGWVLSAAPRSVNKDRNPGGGARNAVLGQDACSRTADSCGRLRPAGERLGAVEHHARCEDTRLLLPHWARVEARARLRLAGDHLQLVPRRRQQLQAVRLPLLPPARGPDRAHPGAPGRVAVVLRQHQLLLLPPPR